MTQARTKPIVMKDADPKTVPLDQIDMSQPELYLHNLQFPFFDRLREEAPVHYCAIGEFEPFWSITRFDDITEIEKNHQLFSSEPTVLLQDPPEDMPFQSFLQMDPPKHCEQRASVQDSVAPRNLVNLEPVIRERAARILDELPTDETFNWVENVSVELTTQMLATLIGVPYEERHKITYWADITADLNGGDLVTHEERRSAPKTPVAPT
jgi:cytochrome P450